jgi:carboxymethylenebutenolidase
MIERVSFTSRDGAPADGAMAVPTAAKAPAVVVLQEYWGLNDQIRHTVQRLADDGFLALAPDLYHGAFATSASEASAMMGKLDWPRAIAEIGGAVDFLRESPRGNGKVAVIGFCLGGALALASACQIKGLDGVVPFYGIPQKADWSQVDAPILAHVASHDDWVTPAKAREIQDTLCAGGKAMQVEVYDAKHAFMNERRPEVYEPKAAQVAWSRTIDFLRRHTT